MILEARYLFILYYFNLIYLATAPIKLQFFDRFSSNTERSEKKQISLIKVATSSLIINDVLKRYEDYFNRNGDDSSKLKIFMENMIESDNLEDIIKITFVVYVAFEYWYSLALCMIWNRTTKDIPEVIINQIPLLKELKEDSILEECSKISHPFYNLVQTYLNVTDEIENSERRKARHLQHINPFPEIILCLRNCIHSMNTYVDVEKNFEFTGQNIEQLRYFLYGLIGDYSSTCSNELRSYFDKSNIDIGAPDFRANISSFSFINGSYEGEAKISPAEQFLWRNIINILNSNKVSVLNDLLILLTCEELRYEVTLYMTGQMSQIYPVTVQRQYTYSNFIINIENNKFDICFI